MGTLNPPRDAAQGGSAAADAADPARQRGVPPNGPDVDRAQTQEDDALDNVREGYGIARREQDRQARTDDPSGPGGLRGNPSNPRTDNQ